MDKIWSSLLETPQNGRLTKPRQVGITMIIDKGLSLPETENLLSLNAPYIDLIKLSFGTTVLYPETTLVKKLALAAEYQIPLYPGGTFFELCYTQQKADTYFQLLRRLGFQWVEISDGTIELPVTDRNRAIRQALEHGLKVITEVGKKNPVAQPEETLLAWEGLSDIEAGASWVIIEARESGQGIGVYDSKGNIINDKIAAFTDRLPLNRVIWEAPLKNQQAWLINQFGPNVNLGNIPPTEAMALEALRLGLRSDTWKNPQKK